MRKIAFAGLIFCFWACSPNNNPKTSEGTAIIENGPNSMGVKVVHKSSYRLGEAVLMSIENSSDTMAYIFQPNYLSIQKLVDSVWTDLRIIPCPCGAPCAPPGYQPLEPYQLIDLAWDQRESWCEPADNELGLEMKWQEVKPGTYRWIVKSNRKSNSEGLGDEIQELVFKIK